MTDCIIMSKYTPIYNHAVSLFGANCVKWVEKENSIKIKTSFIQVVLICSGNEYKTYITTHNVRTDEAIVLVRLMSENSIKGYLDIKKVEHDFLKDNEG